MHDHERAPNVPRHLWKHTKNRVISLETDNLLSVCCVCPPTFTARAQMEVFILFLFCSTLIKIFTRPSYSFLFDIDVQFLIVFLSFFTKR